MFSDIHSVRSVPNSPGRALFRQPPPPFDFQSPSEHSRVRSPRHYQHWRTNIHPEIHDKYRLIVNGQPLNWNQTQRPPSQPKKGDLVDNCTASRSQSPDRNSVQRADHDEKVRTLEEQNSNLREELYYLRQALLINFQSKEQPEEKEEKKRSSRRSENRQRK